MTSQTHPSLAALIVTQQVATHQFIPAHLRANANRLLSEHQRINDLIVSLLTEDQMNELNAHIKPSPEIRIASTVRFDTTPS